MMLQTRGGKTDTPKKTISSAVRESVGVSSLSPPPAVRSRLPSPAVYPRQRLPPLASDGGGSRARPTDSSIIDRDQPPAGSVPPPAPVSPAPATPATPAGRVKRQIPAGVAVGQLRLVSPRRRPAPSTDQPLPRLRTPSVCSEGAAAAAAGVLPRPQPTGGGAATMEHTEDANFNPVVVRRTGLGSAALSPSLRRRESTGSPRRRPDSSCSPVLSARPRSTILNDNQQPRPGTGPAPDTAGLTAAGGRSQNGRPVARSASIDATAEEVMLDENVNPAAVRKTRGKALIIRRGASISSPPPRSGNAPLVGKAGFRDSEAGPEVALLSEDLFGPAAAFFQDTAAVDVLAGAGPGLSSPSADRDSLLVRCDPRLVRPAAPIARRKRTQQEEGVSAHERQLTSKEELIAFSAADDSLKKRPVAPVGPSPAPPDVAQPSPAPSPTPAPAPAPAQTAPAPAVSSQEQKAQELMLQEKLLKRDREIKTLQETVTKLKQQLAASQTTQQRMAKVVERHSSALAQLAASKVQHEKQQAQQLQRLKVERDEAREEVANIETMFADLHRKYEKSKALVAENRQSSDLVSAELDHAISQVSREQQRYDMLQQYAEDTMQRLQTDMELEQKSQETETLRMSARLQLAENRATKLERENQEVTAICDELIQKMGGAR